MNHFWKSWMDFKVFPEVLLSFLSNLFKKDLVDWKQNVQTGYQGDLKKKNKRKWNPLKYIKNSSKNQKNKFLICFDLVAASLQWGKEYIFMTTFLENYLSVWLLFFRDTLDW